MPADVLLDETTETIDVVELTIPDVPIPCEHYRNGKPCGDLAEWTARAVCAAGHSIVSHVCTVCRGIAETNFASPRTAFRDIPPCRAEILSIRFEPLR